MEAAYQVVEVVEAATQQVVEVLVAVDQVDVAEQIEVV